jgi:hypothetical protein
MTDHEVDLLGQRLAAFAHPQDDSDWTAIHRRQRRLPRLVLGIGLLVVAVVAAGAVFGLYREVLPFASQEPAPAPVVKDFQTLFGGEAAPPGMDPHVLAGETKRVATYAGGKYVLYVAPTKTGGFCESFVRLFGGCRQERTLPPGAPIGRPDEIDPFAIGTMGAMSGNGPTILGGDLLLPAGTSLSVEFADGSSAAIPVVFVSSPIDAGFFLYPVPAEHLRVGHGARYLVAHDPHGDVVAKARISGPTHPQVPLPERTLKPSQLKPSQ